MTTSIKALSEAEQALCLAANPEQRYHQNWFRGTSICMTALLCDIGGWNVDCYNDRRARDVVQFAVNTGLVGYRMHYPPDVPIGVPSYELTDAGLAYLRRQVPMGTIASVIHTREFYRARARRNKPAPKKRVKKIDTT